MDALTMNALYVATFINAAIPGPCAILTAGRTARYGVRSGLAVSWGVVAGAIVITSIAFATMLGVLAVSSQMLQLMKWAGVVTLLVLAVRTLWHPEHHDSTGSDRRSSVSDYCAGMIVVVSSPAVLVFLLALLPQFIASGTSNFRPAMIAAGAFVSGVAAAQAAAILFGACSLRIGWLRPRSLELVCAALFIGFACAAVFAPVGSMASAIE